MSLPACSLQVLAFYAFKKKKKKMLGQLMENVTWALYCHPGLKGSKTDELQGVNCFVCSLRKTSLIFYCPAFAQSSKLSLGKWLIFKRDAVMAEDVLASLPFSDSLWKVIAVVV